MSKIVSFLVALALAYNLSTGVVYGDTITNTATTTIEASTEVDLESLLENIDNIDIDSLDEETRQALINKLVSDGFQDESYVDFAELDAGLTPDSFFYFLDKLVDDIRLSLASTPEDKAEILSQLALERLAEFNIMEPENKVKYVQDIINEYIDLIGQATAAVEEAQTENPEGDFSDIIDQIDNVIDSSSDIIDPEQLPEEVEAEVSDQLEAVEDIVINAKSVAGIDKEVVVELREQGLGYGEIKLLSKISTLSEKTIDEVVNVYLETKGIGATMKAIGISPSQLNGKDKKNRIQEETAEVNDEVEKEAVEQAEEAVEQVEEATVENQTEVEEIKTTESVDVQEISSEISDYQVEVNKNQDKNNEMKKVEEEKAEAEKKAVEQKAETEKKAAEQKAEAEKKAAENKAEAEKKAAEKKAEADKKASEKKTESSKKSQ